MVDGGRADKIVLMVYARYIVTQKKVYLYQTTAVISVILRSMSDSQAMRS